MTTLVSVFEASLRMLSPFMPFFTEELWHAVYDGDPPAKSIALAQYPQGEAPVDTAALGRMSFLQSLVVDVRALRKEIGVEEKAFTPIELRIDAQVRAVIEANRDIVERLAKVNEIRFVNEVNVGLPVRTKLYFDVAVIYERTVNVAAERERLTKDIAKLEKNLASSERQLSNESYLAKAPAQAIEGLRKQDAETRATRKGRAAPLPAIKAAKNASDPRCQMAVDRHDPI